jgi:RNA polymerase sigma-70 factor, ECF subfamily
MADATRDDLRGIIENIYRSESRRVFASLVRLLGDFDVAEEALQDAFAAAMQSWPREGLPHNPRAWLISAGRFKGIDAIRRAGRHDASMAELAQRLQRQPLDTAHADAAEGVEDDRLRLIFTCCHPAIAPEAQIALTLREVCGLTTEAIASAFLTTPSTMAQRIVRAKAKIRDARIPYQVPSRDELPERLESVLHVIYLVFNEGYSASSGETVTRPDLSGEAIRLGRLLLELLPETEVLGLLALMLLHESRRTARTTASGEIVLLDQQDRSLWNRQLIVEGQALVEQALARQPVGAMTLQAAIALSHAQAPTPDETNWRRIIALYDLLLRLQPSPVIELNRAVAVAMQSGPQAGLERIDAILEEGNLRDYHLAHAARADLLRRLDRKHEARAAYERALMLARQEPERRFLQSRLRELQE